MRKQKDIIMNFHKELLQIFCDHATAIAKKNGYDIDVAKTLMISAEKMPGNTKFCLWEIFDKNSKYNVIWKILEGLEVFFDGEKFQTNVFDDVVPNIVHKTLWQSLNHHGANICIKKSNYDENQEQHINVLKQIKQEIDKQKSIDPNWIKRNPQHIKALQNNISAMANEFYVSSTFEFEFVPEEKIDTIEQAKIWCNLHI